MIKVLRPVRKTSLVSADVFESLFMKNLGDVLDIHPVPLLRFCDELLGPWGHELAYSQAAEKFGLFSRGYDFFCPGYECIALAPLFLSLRNTSKSDIRLLLIAHSAGVYAMEWALLRPLLVPGDLIVAPSMSAKNAIEWLCPELAPFVTAINHPIAFLPRTNSLSITNSSENENKNEEGIAKKKRRDIKLVTLTRIDPSKLIHRQIEAVGLLVNRGLKNIRMYIAGSLEDPLTGKLSIYSRSLKAKINRLKLEEHVFLVGLIDGEEAKSHFLEGARISLNLSNSCEEAFPKASVEPLGMGIPVIACAWNGYVETVGDCGKLIPLTEFIEGFPDLMPEHIADAIIELLEHPVPADRCISHAQQFLPSLAKEKYTAALSKAMQFHPRLEIEDDTIMDYKGGITDTLGLIGKIACLQPFSWKKMMEFHWNYSKIIRATWLKVTVNANIAYYNEAVLRDIIMLSIFTPLSYFYAGRIHKKNCPNHCHDIDLASHLEKWTSCAGHINKSYGNHIDFWQTIAEAVDSWSIISSKTACLYAISKKNAPDLLEKSLDTIEPGVLPPVSSFYYQSKVYFGKKDYSKAYDVCVKALQYNKTTCYNSPLLRQIASICREWQKPQLALPWLKSWLEKFPDDPDSGAVWLEYAYNLVYSDDEGGTELPSILDNVKALLGDLQPVKALEYTFRLSRWFTS